MQIADNEDNKIDRLKQVISDKGLNQRKIADLLGLKAPNLSAILNKKEGRTLPYGTSYILEAELGINRIWFDTGEGEMNKVVELDNSKVSDKLIEAHQEIIKILKGGK